MFICRDCGEHAIGIVLKATAAGVIGVGHIEIPQGWRCATTVGGASFVCRSCAVVKGTTPSGRCPGFGEHTEACMTMCERRGDCPYLEQFEADAARGEQAAIAAFKGPGL